MSEILGKNLKLLREKLGYAQKDIAAKIGVKPNTLSGYESGSRTPDPDTMVKLAEIYEVSLDYLLGRTDASKNEIDDKKEMMEFFNNPRLNLFFKEMADSPEEQLEELQEFWEIIKKRGLNKK
ncbi:helix-turn-helix domain-containing protein [Domibacillus iocasae]|uniref:HTH cro/C1-type domain-containing protein n=1 Tax=Domibacillus iocasae TaxID=1714016 RepID=A0A1E7DRY6_9BACI|nr:helix-turn-helix transcriptional regulator [Domibacillus iocasae]OES45843.1 hypothetical protein BA724_03305 [Domibacillus iocasae]